MKKFIIVVSVATILQLLLPVTVSAKGYLNVTERKPHSRVEEYVDLDADENEYESVAITKMNDLNEIMGILASSPMYTTDEGTSNVYVKVNRFKSKKSFKSFIKATCSGELRDNLLKECKNCLKEKNGSLYVKKAGRSFFIFRTDKGVKISDTKISKNGKIIAFTAKTKDSDEMNGAGIADCVYDKKWRIESYRFE